MRYVVDSIIKVGAGTNIPRVGTETAEIINLYVPSEIEINTPFTVEYDGWNKTTATLTLYGFIEEAGVGMISDSYWQQDVIANGTHAGDYYFSYGINDTFTGQITLGHVEEECSPEGATQCQGDDVYVCQGGQWIFQETCPYGCLDGECLTQPTECGDITDPAICNSTFGCFWDPYQQKCLPWPCSHWQNYDDCTQAGCWWDPYKQECVIPTCEAWQTPEECIEHGCLWTAEGCKPAGGLPINWLIVAPIAAVVGIGLIVGITRMKKK